MVCLEHRKIGIYQASNLLFNQKDIYQELKENEVVENKPLKRSKMVCDILLKCILGENRISSATFHDQMAFAKKSLRKKNYSIF